MPESDSTWWLVIKQQIRSLHNNVTALQRGETNELAAVTHPPQFALTSKLLNSPKNYILYLLTSFIIDHTLKPLSTCHDPTWFLQVFLPHLQKTEHYGLLSSLTRLNYTSCFSWRPLANGVQARITWDNWVPAAKCDITLWGQPHTTRKKLIRSRPLVPDTFWSDTNVATGSF